MRAILIVLGCMLLAGLMVACANGKSKQNMVVEETVDQRDWASEGYIPVTVVYDASKPEACRVLLQQEDAKTIWEPMTLDKTFIENGTKLWVKVHPQRRPSKCDAMPCGVDAAHVRK